MTRAKRGPSKVTIPVLIEYGNHTTAAYLHALPRVGEKMSCAFPASGIPRLFLVVTGIAHRQVREFDGDECRDPFAIFVLTDDDPMHAAENRTVFEKLIRGKG